MKKKQHIDERLIHAARRNAEKIANSDFFLVLFNDKMLEDPTPLLQMGLAVYMDKPIYLLVPQDTPIPENLRRMARKIEYYWANPDDMSSIENATSKLIKRVSEEHQ